MNDFCRTCLRSPQKSLNLENCSELLTKIETIASIKVIMHEHLPNSVCEECVGNIKKLYNFRKVIRNSDLELKERLQALENSKQMIQNTTNDESIENAELATQNFDLQLKECLQALEISKQMIQNTNDESIENAELATQNFNDENIKNEINEILIKSENDVVKQEIVVDSQSKTFKKPVPKCTVRTKRKSKPESIRIAKHWGYNAGQNTRQYNCTDCNSTFKGYLVWRRHQQTVHAERGMCNVCGKTMRKENLSKHVRNHSNGHVCKVCGESFKNYVLMRTHTYERHKGTKLDCNICGKIFHYHGDLNRHVKFHTKAVPRVKVQCTVCGKDVEKRSIKKHMRTHTGERPYPCEYCKKGFSSPYALKTHVRQHTNEKPYICEYCSMGFPQKVSLVTHIKSKHSDKE